MPRRKSSTAKDASRKCLSASAFQQAAECLKILAHPHRLKIVQMLLEKQYTVGELAQACEIAHHMTSEHLRLMQRCGFLDSIKDGQRRYYQVIEPQLANIIHCVEQRFGK
jgi:ArsR family transcriptional regulator, zinc-responsive transcriptional repressor